MERVFHELGLGDTSVIHDFYQSRIINYHTHLTERCQSLKRDFDRMKNPEFNLNDPNFLRFVWLCGILLNGI